MEGVGPREPVVLAVKLIAVATAVAIGSLYLELGPLMPIMYGVGLAIALAVSAKQWRSFSRPVVAFAVVSLGYLTMQAVGTALLTTESTVTHDMTWRIDPPPPGSTLPEVLLDFVQQPGNTVAIRSSDIADHLRSSESGTVAVEFAVTRDLGCLRGFHATRIGSLDSWRSGPGGYAGTRGDAASPWADPWWCP